MSTRAPVGRGLCSLSLGAGQAISCPTMLNAWRPGRMSIVESYHISEVDLTANLKMALKLCKISKHWLRWIKKTLSIFKLIFSYLIFIVLKIYFSIWSNALLPHLSRISYTIRIRLIFWIAITVYITIRSIDQIFFKEYKSEKVSYVKIYGL